MFPWRWGVVLDKLRDPTDGFEQCGRGVWDLFFFLRDVSQCTLEVCWYSISRSWGSSSWPSPLLKCMLFDFRSTSKFKMFCNKFPCSKSALTPERKRFTALSTEYVGESIFSTRDWLSREDIRGVFWTPPRIRAYGWAPLPDVVFDLLLFFGSRILRLNCLKLFLYDCVWKDNGAGCPRMRLLILCEKLQEIPRVG